MSLGYTEQQDIIEYVKEVQNREREERHAQRARDQRERDSQAEYNLTLAKLELAKVDAMQADARRAHELALKEQANQHELALRSVAPVATTAATIGGPKLKIRQFPSDPDKVEAYFTYFEDVASDFKWDDRTKLHQLIPHLQDKGQDVYYRLETDGGLTYAELKAALMEAFGLHLEEAREKFTTALMEDGETCSIFASRLHHHFKTWQRLSELPDTKEGLAELIVVTQLINSFPKTLRAMLRTDKVMRLKETIEKAEA